MLIQKEARRVHAWCLGEGSRMEQELLRAGKLCRMEDGSYRVFSQENDTEGQLAQPGDYFKVDSTGAPYPNDRAFFLRNHTHIESDCYLQTSPVLKAWCLAEKMCPEIVFLVRTGALRIDESSSSHYFTAFMWGAWLHAAKDAVIIFDNVEESGGTIVNVAFHFITREEFEKTYRVVDAS